jgi:hypothetical protein
MVLLVTDVPERPKNEKAQRGRHIDDAARRPPKAVYGANMMLA